MARISPPPVSILILFFAAALSVVAPLSPVAEGSAREPYKQTPYKVMMDDPLDFSGYEATNMTPGKEGGIAIGLFAPGISSGRPGCCLVRGARLALDEANAHGGDDRPPYTLIRRWAEDPWNAGSREMLRLAFKDRTPAVIGFLSDSSHVAEQIATKAYLPVVTPVSTDPSLTQARVPWIFRLPPDDASQAEVLVKQGLLGQGYSSPGLITGADQDSRMAAGELLDELKRQKRPPRFHLVLPADMVDFPKIAQRIGRFNPDSLILRLKPGFVSGLIHALNEAGLRYPVILPWIPGLDTDELSSNLDTPLIVVEPFERSMENERYRHFFQAYTARFGVAPSFSAAYAYDAADMIVNALQSGGLSRKGVRKALADGKKALGASGRIDWDSGGGNQARPVIRVYSDNNKPTRQRND